MIREQALAEGVQQGIQQGIQQGARDANIATARNLLASGVPMNVIASATGLSEEQIKNL